MNKDFLQVLSGYASDFHAAVETKEGDNIVASPLGSWMLLASLAASTDFTHTVNEKAAIEVALHTTVEEAATYLKELLNIEQLNYISQVWYREKIAVDFPQVISWLKTNDIVETLDDVPSQDELDKWTAENTHDLIKKFPVEVDEEMFFLMANIIYSKLNWRNSFRVVKNDFMESVWNTSEFLYSEETHVKFFEVDGSVYISYPVVAVTKEIVYLTLPLGEAEDDTLLSVAHRIATDDNVRELSYLDVEQVENVFTLSTRQGSTPRVSRVSLPAWTAESNHDLYENPTYGYYPLSYALAYGALAPWEAKAAQTAVAKFKKDGFEAAAVTAFGMMRASSMMSTISQDVLTVNFSKPFAFICAIEGVPAFSGVINKADKETK